MNATRVLLCFASVAIAAVSLGSESDELTSERRAELLDKFPDLKNAEAAYAKAAREANERRAMAYKSVIDKAAKGKFDADKVAFAKMRLKELESGMDLDGEGQVAGAKIKVLAAMWGGRSLPKSELEIAGGGRKAIGVNNVIWVDVTRQVKNLIGDKREAEFSAAGFPNLPDGLIDGPERLVIRYSISGKPAIASTFAGSTIRIP